MNTINLIGRTTSAIELRQTPNGKLVTNFTLAVNDGKDKSYFIDCVAWEKTAELIEKFIPKGSMLGLNGKLTTRSYEDKNGNKRKQTEVLVEKIHFIEKRTERVIDVEFDTGPMIEITDDQLPF
jgi:single-strand DNA-binding protein